MKSKNLAKYFLLATVLLLPLLTSCSAPQEDQEDTGLTLPGQPQTSEQPPELPSGEEAMPLPPSEDSKPEGNLFG